MKKDFKNNIAPVLLLEPFNAASTTTASSVLDTADCNGIEIDAIIGVLTGVTAANYVIPVLQESDTTVGTDFTDVSAANIVGGFSKVDSTSLDSVIQRAGYIGHKRYVRVKFVYTGAGITAGIVGAVGILGHSKDAPVIAPAAITAT